MEEGVPNIYVLDSAYKPFPTFKEWVSAVKVETGRWDRYKKALERSSELSNEQLQHARRIAKRAAALDTGAIEGLYEVDRGFTYTVAFELAEWETALLQKGEHVKSLFSAQLNAYDYVLDFATKREPISEAAIRELHSTVCRAQETYRVITPIGPQEQPLPKGQYKILPNHPYTKNQTYHSYAPVDVTPSEMQRLVKELRSPEFEEAHPVVQAAYAHYGFVVIHPFSDGNGRVARALASVFAYRAVSTPIVILSEQKGAYLDSLEKADQGQYQAFVDFVMDRFLDTIKLVDESIRSALAPDPEKVLESINSLYITKGGYTDKQVDDFGGRLLALAEKEFSKVLPKFNSPKTKTSSTIQPGNVAITPQNKQQLSATMANITVPSTFPDRHRPATDNSKILNLKMESIAPAAAHVFRVFAVLVPRDASGEDDVVMWSSNGKYIFTARLDEIKQPNPGFLQIRLALFAERIAADMLAELSTQAAIAIKAIR